IGTIRLLQTALEHGTQLVFSSTGGAIYGECERPAPEEATRRPMAPYGVSKLAGEEYLAMFNRLYGTRHVSLHYSNVHGPRPAPASSRGASSTRVEPSTSSAGGRGGLWRTVCARPGIGFRLGEGAGPGGPNQVRPVELSLPQPQPWRTATVVASAVAAFELV